MIAKLNFQHHYSSLQFHMILKPDLFFLVLINFLLIIIFNVENIFSGLFDEYNFQKNRIKHFALF